MAAESIFEPQNARVAQFGRASDFGSEGHRFNSYPVYGNPTAVWTQTGEGYQPHSVRLFLCPYLSGMLEHIAFAIAVIAVVYIDILAYEQPFNKWWVWGARFERYWFYKPLWDCEKCFAGQAALWTYPALVSFRTYNPFQHLYFVCLSILTAFVLSKIFTFLEKIKR